MPASSVGLAADLRAAVAGEVRFSDADRALYAADASIYRQLPIGIVLPRDDEDVLATLDVCRRRGAAVLPRGAGTSEAGQTCNQAVVLDFSRHMNRILALDPEGRQARVQPGVVLDRLRSEAERHHLTFGPDPSTHAVCTLGGMIGNNSCGVHSVMAGTTVRNVHELEVVTYRGARLRLGPMPTPVPMGGAGAAADTAAAISTQLALLAERTAPLVRARFPSIPRRISGYNLDELLPERGPNLARALVGTEGTCAVLLAATVRLVESPPERVLVVLGFADVAEAADAVPAVLAHRPIAVEGLDDRLVAAVRHHGISLEALGAMPPGRGWLLVEFGAGGANEAADAARRCGTAL
ncbi:MAG: FAD-binding oxidoreductase, partial [Solirubrobacteraceae bacterium]